MIWKRRKIILKIKISIDGETEKAKEVKEEIDKLLLKHFTWWKYEYSEHKAIA